LGVALGKTRERKKGREHNWRGGILSQKKGPGHHSKDQPKKFHDKNKRGEGRNEIG